MQLSDLEELRDPEIAEEVLILRRNHSSVEWRGAESTDGEWNLTIEMRPYAERVWGTNKTA